MFTGIVKATGTVAGIRPRSGDLRLSIDSSGLPWGEYRIGESISVNGVCLTATGFRDQGFDADVSAETMKVTALGQMAEGGRVNLEPALRLDERLGGHLVSGHVDGIGTVVAQRREARSVRFDVELPPALSRYVAAKGSICLDGVSLTVNEVTGTAFSVNIVPHTVGATVLGDWREGTKVNVEVDLLARYVERLLSADGGSALSRKFLEEHGYA